MTERRRLKLEKRRSENEQKQKRDVQYIVELVKRGKCCRPKGMFCLTCTVPMSAIFHGGDIAGKCSFNYFKRGVALWNIIKDDVKRCYEGKMLTTDTVTLVEQRLREEGILK